MARRSRPGETHPPRGGTLLGVLIAIAIAGTALAGAGTLWSTMSRRDREAELLFVGEQFRSAIARYREQTPIGQPPALPKSFDDLLDDKRWPVKRRHLRKVFVDPITGTHEWGLLRTPEGGLYGVYSLSELAPLKHAHFGRDQEEFAQARSYREWRFAYAAGAPASAPQAGAAAQGPPR